MTDWMKISVLLLMAVIFAGILCVLGPLPQPQNYHYFADQRRWFMIPNFMNVITNLAFLWVGIVGLIFLHRRHKINHDWRDFLYYWIFFAAMIAVALGSAFYHYAPNNAALVWDRLPIVIALMSFFAAQITERINVHWGLRLLPLLLLIGISSVFYWEYSEIRGQGDLRFYLFVLLYPLFALPLIFLFFKTNYSQTKWLWIALLLYVLARIAEGVDHVCYRWTVGVLSGHSLKHLLAAGAAYSVYIYLRKRTALHTIKNA